MSNHPTIGILIGNANSPHSIGVLSGIAAAADELSYHQVIMVNVEADDGTSAESEKKTLNPVFRTIEHTHMDALILSYGTLCNYMNPEDLKDLLDRIQDIPHVILEAPILNTNGSYIVSDNAAGMQELMEHLISHHHRKNLTCLSGPGMNPDSMERTQAFYDALRAHGLPAEPERTVEGDFTFYVEDEVRELLRRYPDLDAMVCANDNMAETAVRVLSAAGKRVGSDISVSGYDNWMLSEHLTHPLTTVSQKSEQMGYHAIYEIQALLSGEAPHGQVLPSKLVTRASCGCSFTRTETAESIDRKLVTFYDSLHHYRLETWQLPRIAKTMSANRETEERFLSAAMEHLAGFGAKRAYLYLYKNALNQKDSDSCTGEGTLFLAAEEVNGAVKAYDESHRTPLSYSEGFHALYPEDTLLNLIVFSLNSGSTSYGFLVLQTSSEEIPFFYALSMQLANSFRYYEISKQMERTQVRMQNLLTELNERNEVLSFVSEYDPMTGALNRRGFMEALIKYLSVHDGEKAVLCYADLDHLKMINDIFGHNEGDFSLKKTTEILKDQLPEAILGRIGGDEYIFLQPYYGENALADTLLQLKNAFAEFNRTSDRAYYIEVSLGYTIFTCRKDLSLPTLLNTADENLYYAKKKRRKQICKYQGAEEALLATAGYHPPVEQLYPIIDLTAATMDNFMYVFNIRDNFFHISPSAPLRFFLPSDSFHNTDEIIKEVVYPEDYPDLLLEMQDLKDTNRMTHNMRYRWLSRDQKPVWVNNRGVIVRDESGKMLYMVGCINEIGAAPAADYFSGLLRADSMCEFLDAYQGLSLTGYALRLDVDDMRGINAHLGQDKGDLALSVAVDSIRHEMSRDQQLYRIGGDEFMIIDTSTNSSREALLQYDRIRNNLEHYMKNSSYELILTVSCGILPFSVLPEMNSSEVLKYTEFSLGEAKMKGKSASYVFQPEEYREHLRKRALLKELRSAISSGFKGFSAVYQPVVNTEKKTVTGTEALLRFTTSDGTSVPPKDFIPVLEQSGLIVDVGVWILREACRTLSDIQKYRPEFKMGINVSAVQVQRSDVAGKILRTLKEFHLSPASVVVELTESGYLETEERFNRFWRRLQKEGVRLALDDFGTGYSNFRYLNELKPDIIKIDYGFTKTAMTDPFEMELLKSIRHMATNLGLKVCIEGIETAEMHQEMAKLSPSYFQGYLFGCPMPAERFLSDYISP